MNARILLAGLLLAACAPRGELAFAPPVPEAKLVPIYVADFRATEPPPGPRRSPPRPPEVRFTRLDVSIPPTHEPGRVEWPKGTPDASTDFVATDEATYPDLPSFVRQVAQSDSLGEGETVLFVHGYNTNHGEAVYQVAQIKEDFEVSAPMVLFSWPSAAVTAGYVYDRDSALYSRDELADTIEALTQNGRQLALIGHSMGSFLIMETLRQIALERRFAIDERITALVLMAPDIDGELFQDHVRAIGADALPDPFMIFVAKEDRALRISALLTGREERLGSETDATFVEGLPITLIDVSDLATGKNFDHQIVTTSPSAIAILNELSSEVPVGEASLPERVVLSDIGRERGLTGLLD